MTPFTAQNAATLSRQLDTFAAQHPGFAFNYGRDTKNTWFCHAEYGIRPNNFLTFAEMVGIANQEAARLLEAEQAE